MPVKALSIAGFDGSGGAGIQADLKVFSALGCYGMSVLTALPVQNTCGVRRCYELPPGCVEDQLAAIFEDIRPDAIKTGMLFTETIIHTVADFLTEHAQGIPLIVDPVMRAKSGDPLLLPEAEAAFRERIFPLATLITPNAPEAAALSGIAVTDRRAMQAAGDRLMAAGCHAVLIKGGHLDGALSEDWFAAQEDTPCWLSAPRITTGNTHGTGCTLSAAITSFVAHGVPLSEACHRAKGYLLKAMEAARDWHVGKGCGPLHHFPEWWQPMEA